MKAKNAFLFLTALICLSLQVNAQTTCDPATQVLKGSMQPFYKQVMHVSISLYKTDDVTFEEIRATSKELCAALGLEFKFKNGCSYKISYPALSYLGLGSVTHYHTTNVDLPEKNGLSRSEVEEKVEQILYAMTNRSSIRGEFDVDNKYIQVGETWVQSEGCR